LLTHASYDGSFFFELLPYLEQPALYASGTRAGNNQTAAGNGPFPALPPFAAARVKMFVCPADSTLGDSPLTLGCVGSSYAANYQLLGTVYNGGLTGPFSAGTIPDGSSNTVLVTEKLANAQASGGGTAWACPYISAYWPVVGYFSTEPPQVVPSRAAIQFARPSTMHASGALAVLADGSVRTVPPSVSKASWRHALFPDDGSGPGPEW
jgi:hypothetical protein